jgi:hypothetical protein
MMMNCIMRGFIICILHRRVNKSGMMKGVGHVACIRAM